MHYYFGFFEILDSHWNYLLFTNPIYSIIWYFKRIIQTTIVSKNFYFVLIFSLKISLIIHVYESTRYITLKKVINSKSSLILFYFTEQVIKDQNSSINLERSHIIALSQIQYWGFLMHPRDMRPISLGKAVNILSKKFE